MERSLALTAIAPGPTEGIRHSANVIVTTMRAGTAVPLMTEGLIRAKWRGRRRCADSK
jgi:hypothetical protein